MKAGTDLIELKQRYGDRLAFMGGIDARAMAHPDPAVIDALCFPHARVLAHARTKRAEVIMVTLATLDAASEQSLQALERASGAWLLAYTPPAPSDPVPPYAAQLKPARLDAAALQRLQALERQSGSCIVAYEPLPHP